MKFVHLIEKMEQMAVSTFEGEFFPTGVIFSSDFSKYRDNYFEFKTERDINYLDKREWFLANGQESFFCWILIARQEECTENLCLL